MMHFPSFLGRPLCAAVALAALSGSLRVTATPTLRAASAMVDLTPAVPKNLGGYGPRESTGVHDPIHHRVLVLHDGATEWVLVASEFCVISPDTYDKAARRLEAEQGIKPVNFWWSLTHTHSAPEVGPPGLAAAYLGERYQHRVDEPYAAFVEDALVAAVAEARARLQPAHIGFGWGESKANINRRARDVDGTTSLGMNPDGPVDQRIGVLRVRDEQGGLIALLANYPIHGTVLGSQSTVISGDAPGVVSLYLEEQLGAPVLFINGAAGNIAPIYSVYPNPRAGHLSQFRVLLGDRIRQAADAITGDLEIGRMVAREFTATLPRRMDLAWPAELDRFVAGGNTAGVVRLPLRLLELNRDVAVWSAPLELFCEVSNEVRDLSPYPSTLYFGYTNGWFGYLLTDEELGLGGYEIRVTPFAKGAAEGLRDTVLETLRGQRESRQ